MPHVTDGKTTKWWILVVRLNAHRLGRNELDDASIARLDELGRRLHNLTRPTVNLLNELSKLARDVGGVAIEHRRVAGTNLTRVVEHNDLRIEGRSLFCRIILSVGADISTANFLNGDVPRERLNNVTGGERFYELDVESDVVTRLATLRELLVMHFNRLHFSSNVRGCEVYNHASLDDTGFNTADRDSSDTTNLVHILERETERLVAWTNRRIDGINGLEQRLASYRYGLYLLGPALVPGHAAVPINNNL